MLSIDAKFKDFKIKKLLYKEAINKSLSRWRNKLLWPIRA